MNVTYACFIVMTVSFAFLHGVPHVYETYGVFIRLLCHPTLVFECHNEDYMTLKIEFSVISTSLVVQCESFSMAHTFSEAFLFNEDAHDKNH